MALGYNAALSVTTCCEEQPVDSIVRRKKASAAARSCVATFLARSGPRCLSQEAGPASVLHHQMREAIVAISEPGAIAAWATHELILLVAERTVRYARVVGRENVMAGTDCGLGGR